MLSIVYTVLVDSIWKRRARTRLSELPGRKLRHPARWLWYLLPGLAGTRCAGSFRTKER